MREKNVESRPAKLLAFLLKALSAIALSILMLITCIDVIGRYLFNSPLTGSTELTEMAVGIVVFSVFPLISWQKEHVVVDIFDKFVSSKMDFFRSVLFNILMSVGLYFIGGRIIVLGNRSLGYGEVSEYLSIPTGWMINFIGGMCWLTAFLLMTFGMHTAYRSLLINHTANSRN